MTGVVMSFQISVEKGYGKNMGRFNGRVGI